MEKSNKIFQRRKATLKKKAGELGALCNSEVCIVCYEPNGEMEVWPEDPTKAHSIIHKYYSRLESCNNNKKREKLNLSDMLEKKMKKLEEQVGNHHHHHYHLDNISVNTNTSNGVGFPIVLPSLWDEELDNFSNDSLMGLSQCLEAKIQKLDEKIELLKGKQRLVSQTQFLKEEHCDCDLPPSLPQHYVSVIKPQEYAASSSHAYSNMLYGDIAQHQSINNFPVHGLEQYWTKMN
ncbi:MADS-box transcription factor [Parasponia andersonii]|uniref:MADS-box transcription factor n=1 Tax=Parasponia andersonii TaxID=3476 RepID=A0A2P5CXL0_PARAD|nr:MADS-box transcription factor [Parasponia andersonii]